MTDRSFLLLTSACYTLQYAGRGDAGGPGVASTVGASCDTSSLLPFPWRGLIDAGVVVGLGWGALSVVWFGGQALRGNPPDYDLSLPGTPSPRATAKREGRPDDGTAF